MPPAPAKKFYEIKFFSIRCSHRNNKGGFGGDRIFAKNRDFLCPRPLKKGGFQGQFLVMCVVDGKGTPVTFQTPEMARKRSIYQHLRSFFL